jgi:hypothetical protein
MVYGLINIRWIRHAYFDCTMRTRAGTSSAASANFRMSRPSGFNTNGMHIAGFHTGTATDTLIIDFNLKTFQQGENCIQLFFRHMVVKAERATAITAEANAYQRMGIFEKKNVVINS